MKPARITQTATGTQGRARLIHTGQAFARTAAGKPSATSIVLMTQADTQKQHAAIAKLLKMCQASPVTSASRGITAEVRRDRNRGHV